MLHAFKTKTNQSNLQQPAAATLFKIYSIALFLAQSRNLIGTGETAKFGPK